MGKKEMLSVIDENGEEKIVKLITYFTLLNNENDYIAYTEYDSDDENVKVYVGRVELNENLIYLRTVEEEKEIDEIKEVLVSLSNSPEEGFNYTLNNIDILIKTNNKIIKDIKNIFILKEIFINNIMDNYDYLLNKHEDTFKYLSQNDLFINVNLDSEDEDDVDNHNIDESKYDDDIDFTINKIDLDSIKIPEMDNSFQFNVETESYNPISIDVQIKLDMNNEKIKYLNILKKQIEDEIEKLEIENNQLYNN